MTAYGRAASTAFEESGEASDSWYLEQLIGVVRALREDYVGGYMQTVEELIHAALFDDFLDMAHELLAKGWLDAPPTFGVGLGDRAALPFGLGLVVKRACLKSRQNRVLGTGQQDYGGVQALVRQLVYKAVQIGSCHGLRLR